MKGDDFQRIEIKPEGQRETTFVKSLTQKIYKVKPVLAESEKVENTYSSILSWFPTTKKIEPSRILGFIDILRLDNLGRMQLVRLYFSEPESQ